VNAIFVLNLILEMVPYWENKYDKELISRNGAYQIIISARLFVCCNLY